jgi:small GTP-binding protein
MSQYPKLVLNTSKKSESMTILNKPNMYSNKLSDNHTDHHNDFTFKVVMIGNAAVGKSTLLERYVDGKKSDKKYASTIGVDYKIARTTIDTTAQQQNGTTKKISYSCKLQIWDTAGQERFKSVTQRYYRSGDIFVVCFDASSCDGSGSIQSVANWINDIDAYRSSENPYSIYVLGTKMDKIPHNEINHVNAKYVRQWESSFEDKHIRFIGICSSDTDQFLERSKFPEVSEIVNSDNDEIAIIIEVLDQHQELENNTDQENPDHIPIHMMFRDMVEDHISHHIHGTHVVNNSRKKNAIDLSDSKHGIRSRPCC